MTYREIVNRLMTHFSTNGRIAGEPVMLILCISDDAIRSGRDSVPGLAHIRSLLESRRVSRAAIDETMRVLGARAAA